MSEKAPSGLGVDATGGPVIDPTRNVLDLVDKETKRQDDMRAASSLLNDAKHEHAKEMAALRSEYEEKLRLAESKRLDAIRAVDVAAATLREERASAAATVLANQVATTASTLRDLVASTATAAATAAAAVTNPIAERVSQLERSSYEGSGKSAVADPMMARMVESLETLKRSMAEGQGGQMNRTERRADYGLYIALVAAVLASGLLPRLLS